MYVNRKWTNVLQDVDLCVSFPAKFCIQILKNEMNIFCEGENYIKNGILQKHYNFMTAPVTENFPIFSEGFYSKDIIIYTYIYLLFIFNCHWVDTRWQQYSTLLHTNSTQNTENGTYITIKRRQNWKVLAVPRCCELYSGICLTTEEKARRNLS
jgi:hypothetical protein